MREPQILTTISETLAAYDERAVEFTREDLLVFADDAMRVTTLSLAQVTLALDETKRIYAEEYR